MILDFNKFIKQISEKALNYNQLNLFDDVFSSKTIAETFINQYKSKPIVDKTNKIITVEQAYDYLQDSNNIDDAMKKQIIDDHSSAYDIMSISTDTLYETIINLSVGEVRDILFYFRNNLSNMTSNNLRPLLDEKGALLEPAKFADSYEQLDYYDSTDVVRDIVSIIDDNESRSTEDLERFMKKEVVEEMSKKEMSENLFDNVNTEYHDDLISDIYSQDSGGNRINVFRCLTLPLTASEIKAKTEIRKGVGEYWSYNQSSAESYWAEHSEKENFEIILHGSVNVRNVNWRETLYKSFWNCSQEREIELTAGTTIQIIGYTLVFKDVKRTIRNLSNYYRDLDVSYSQLNNLLRSISDIDTVKLKKAVTVLI